MANESKHNSQRKLYHEQFADTVIEHLKAGTAPWQKPWVASNAPHNPITGTVYGGSNRVMLAMSGYTDPRWLTVHQANQAGYTIKAGSKGKPIMYWQFTKEVDKLDKDGNPIFDAMGKREKVIVKLDRPISRGTHVFNATQIDGIPPFEISKPLLKWEPQEKAENILAKSGAAIFHDQSDKACYRPSTDEVHLPAKDRFETSDKYYATAMHELAHWTGHESRFDREHGPFGSMAYAKEELRAEIASWMLGTDIGIGHDPKQSAAYVASFVKAIEDDPFVIIRACRDAEHIKEFLMNFDREKILSQVQEVSVSSQVQPESVKRSDNKPVYLSVPFSEKEEAKAAGVKWAADKKLWYVSPDIDLATVQKWLPAQKLKPEVGLTPQEEFAQLLASKGVDLKGDLPILDGVIHRVPLVDDKQNAKNASYIGYADGVPNGWIHNFSSGERTKWVSTGHVLSDEQKQAMIQENLIRRQQRESERIALQNNTAKQVQEYIENRSPASSGHLYLVAKSISPTSGVLESPTGKELIIPIINTDGEIRSAQYINEDGQKRYPAGGQKKGCFHLIGADIQADEDKLKQGEIILAEGYATGASLHQATNKPVAVAFDSGNLETVAINIRKKFPKIAITICADNDVLHKRPDGTLYNVGKDKAEQAAQAVGGKVIVPVFSQTEQATGLKDFNDLHQAHGIDAVKNQMKPSKLLSQDKGKGRGLSL